jgi:hypothetical protein
MASERVSQFRRERLGRNPAAFSSVELCQQRFLLLGWITFQALVIFSIRNREKPNMIGESHGRKD